MPKVYIFQLEGSTVDLVNSYYKVFSILYMNFHRALYVSRLLLVFIAIGVVISYNFDWIVAFDTILFSPYRLVFCKNFCTEFST